MSPDPEQDYFCDGISEEIINSLTRIAGLKVIARSSAFQFKGMSVDIREVGRRLNADVIIEGSVRKAGEQLRITVQAIQPESGHGLWSEVFRRELKDVFAIQEEIAQSVAGLLGVHLPVARARVHPSVRDLKAYTKYLRTRFLENVVRPIVPLRDERGLELFYNVAVTPWFHVTTDLQVITPILEPAKTSLVLGLRAKIDL